MKRLQYIVLCGLLLLAAACEKDTLPLNFSPALTTGTASDIFRVGATLSGSIQKSDGVVVKDCGILISELQSMAEYTEIKTTSTENTFEVPARNLEPGKKYYYCAYAGSGYSIARGEIEEFMTTDSNTPVFGELAVNGKDEKSFTVATTILDEGGSDLILCGFCWKSAESSAAEPTVEDKVSNVSKQSTGISTRIKDLMPNKEYLVRAYGINARGVGYGKTITVSTNNATVPAVSSITPGDSTAVSISVKASILSAGESAISEIGFCWSSESKEPTTNHLKYNATDQLDNPNFTYLLGNLVPETTYYIRAYAVNAQGTGYGDVYMFTTPATTKPGIYSLEDLVAFRDAKNAESDLSKWKNAEGVINIFADIDMKSVENWAPIEKIGADEVLDGNGHKLDNLKMIFAPKETQSFGFINFNNGEIRNLTIDEGGSLEVPEGSASANGAVNLGVFCSSNSGKIYNCNNHAAVAGLDDNICGGIACSNSGTIENCSNYGNIKSKGNASGISNVSHGGKIVNCRNYGTIEAVAGDSYVDSFAGIADYVGTGEISNCSNEGKIISSAGGTVSGIGGKQFGGTVTGCVNKGVVSGGYYTGGIIGEAFLEVSAGGGWGEGSTSATISDCKNEGDVSSTTDATVGGICGVLRVGSVATGYINGGTVNGAPGDDTNAIGRDERYKPVGGSPIEDLPTHEW